MKAFKKIVNVLMWIVIVFISVLALLNMYFLICEKIDKKSTLFGYAYQVGFNYSMKPTLMPNDFLITKKQSLYKIDDIVTFIDKENGKEITHRIVQITANGYVTKGDNVTAFDDEITGEDIIGKVVVVIHGIGGVLRIAKSPFGLIILIAIIVVCGVIIKIVLDDEEEKHANNI